MYFGLLPAHCSCSGLSRGQWYVLIASMLSCLGFAVVLLTLSWKGSLQNLGRWKWYYWNVVLALLSENNTWATTWNVINTTYIIFWTFSFYWLYLFWKQFIYHQASNYAVLLIYYQHNVFCSSCRHHQLCSIVCCMLLY